MESNSVQQGKVFVGGISEETTEEKLIQYFCRYGEVVKSQVIKYRETSIGKGFGFVTFADSSVIDQILQDQHIILGRTVDVKLAIPKGVNREESQQQKSETIIRRKVFVGGLPPYLLVEDLKKYFESFGRIEDAKIILNRATNRGRGFGFITYDSEEAVKSVLQNRFYLLNNKIVEVKYAEPRERRISISNYYYYYPYYAPHYWFNHISVAQPVLVPCWGSYQQINDTHNSLSHQPPANGSAKPPEKEADKHNGSVKISQEEEENGESVKEISQIMVKEFHHPNREDNESN